MKHQQRPLCQYCDKPLRRYGRLKRKHNPQRSTWGDYGDGLFCGLRCGYHWACRCLTRNDFLLKVDQGDGHLVTQITEAAQETQ